MMDKPLFIFGEHDEDTIKQIITALEDDRAVMGVLCADGHLGYSLPIGGVVAYQDAISPSGVGYDIGCGNMAAQTELEVRSVTGRMGEIMDEIYHTISFGIGRKNNEPVDHAIFDDPAWGLESLAPLKQMAREQLGTVGSGNHFVDIFSDVDGEYVWIGVHFGSRGLGHKIASHYIKAGGGTDGMFVKPVVLDVKSYLGQEYLAAMRLAGDYAYAGRQWVVDRVLQILGAKAIWSIHNHHNFAWQERHFDTDLWVVRKGATPAFPEQLGFIGGSMGDWSAIVAGRESVKGERALYSTVHGAGRVMSRSKAAGKTKWKNGQKVKISEGMISREMMNEWLGREGVVLRGAGTDEAPQCYRRLPDVLDAHENTIDVVEWLSPLGVAMAGENEFDPFKD